MNEFKGTPGPWATRKDVRLDKISGEEWAAGIDIYSETGIEVVGTEGINGAGPEEQANATLMAAAPDLLEAVSAFLRYVDSEDDDTESMLQFADALDKARTAQAKALGEQQ